jgi:TolB-like protein/Tfp pilus assembly protein PilF
MDAVASTDICLFESFRLDRRGGALSRRDEGGAYVSVAIGSRALDILGVLVERPGEVLSRTEIIDAVWPGMAVEDSNLNVQIAALRRVLDQDREGGSCIQTVPGRGYRFVAAVTRSDAHASQGGGRPPPRLSIVVLPLTSLSDDREQQYFADGITEDLTTDLSRLAGMIVISCNTAFTYRHKPVETKQIGRELGVRYVLEGSVRRSGSRVRVNVQLIDAETDTHLWAERFDRETGDLFALQTEITSRIAVALNLELIAAEAARPIESPDSLDCIFQGRALASTVGTRHVYAEAIRNFEHALALDPTSVSAQCLLASALAGRAIDNMTETGAVDVRRADELSQQAVAAAARMPYAHYARAQVLRAQGRCEEAIPEYETAIAFNRNWVNAISQLGQCKFLTGKIEEAIELVEQAMRLSPRDPNNSNWFSRIGMVRLLQSRIEDAIVWFERARSENPGHPTKHAHLASAYALKHDMDRAAAELAEARRLSGDDRYASMARLIATGFTGAGYWGVPKVRALFEATYFAGLRKAGMPE